MSFWFFKFFIFTKFSLFSFFFLSLFILFYFSWYNVICLIFFRPNNVICLKKVKKYDLKRENEKSFLTLFIENEGARYGYELYLHPTGCASRNSRGFKKHFHFKIPRKMTEKKDEMQTNEEDLGEGEQGELPVALQCSQCNVILGDSMSWASTNDDLKSITLHSKFICICMFVTCKLNTQGQIFATKCENSFGFSQWNFARIINLESIDSHHITLYDKLKYLWESI